MRDVNNSGSQLAAEVLDEIPREIVNYFNQRGIPPNLPRNSSSSKSDLKRPTRFSA